MSVKFARFVMTALLIAGSLLFCRMAEAQTSVSSTTSTTFTLDSRVITERDTIYAENRKTGTVITDSTMYAATRGATNGSSLSNDLVIGAPVDSSSLARSFMRFVIPAVPTGKTLASSKFEVFPIADSTVNSYDFNFQIVEAKYFDTLFVSIFDSVTGHKGLDTAYTPDIFSSEGTTAGMVINSYVTLPATVQADDSIAILVGDTLNVVLMTTADIAGNLIDAFRSSVTFAGEDSNSVAKGPRLILEYYTTADTSDIHTLRMEKLRTSQYVRVAIRGTSTDATPSTGLQYRRRVDDSATDSTDVVRSPQQSSIWTPYTLDFSAWILDGVWRDSAFIAPGSNVISPFMDFRFTKPDTTGVTIIEIGPITY